MAQRESRAGRWAPVLAVVFAAFLADMALQQGVSWLEDSHGAWGAEQLAQALVATPDRPALAKREGFGLARVVVDKVGARKYAYLPELTYAVHPTKTGVRLDPASDADKAAADAFSRGRKRTEVRMIGSQFRAAIPIDARTVAVTDVARPDWSGVVSRGRVFIGVTAVLGLIIWLMLLRIGRRRWHAPVGALAALALMDAGLGWTWLSFWRGDYIGWTKPFVSGLSSPEFTAQLPPGSMLSLALVLFAAPVLPLVITGTIGWYTASRRSPNRAAYTYIAPAMVGMGVLILAPFGFGILLAFMRHDHGSFSFVGLQNFVRILSSEGVGFWDPLSFYYTLGVTILWTGLNVFLHASIGLGMALVLKSPTLRLKAVYRVLLIVPWAVPNYITALVWKGMFNKQYGLINNLLGTVGVEPVAWFSHFWTSFMANVTTNTWLGFPFMMVVSLGALQSIPQSLYEAADVDGATRWQKFTQITLPLLRPAMVPAIILGSVWTFNMFNIIYLVSAGAPNNSTDILITEAYRWAFEQDRYGYAAAYSLLIFLVLLAYSAVTNRISAGAEGTYE
jgi:ABC-type sugar transport system permease subunit